MKYFKLVATLIDESVLQYKNLTEEQVKELQKIIWVQGLKRKINHTTTELVCPLTIIKAVIMEQEGFVNE